MTSDGPRLLGDEKAVASRLKQIHEPHIYPLTKFVEELRLQAGPDVAIPYFDPWDGGVNADTLFLLEAPGPKAVKSGFISRNNPDETAKNFYELCSAAGLDRKMTVVWNAVPWYIGSGKRIRAATIQDLEAGLRPLSRLLDLLSNVRVVVFVGQKAEKAAPQFSRIKYKMFRCPHPSPMFVNNRPGNRDKILRVLTEVREWISKQDE